MSIVAMKKLNLRPDLDSIEADRMLIADTASYVKQLWQQMNAADLYITAGREFANLHERLKKNSGKDKARIGWVRAFSKDENKFGLDRRLAETYIFVYESFFNLGNVLPTSNLPQSLRALKALAKLKLSAEQLRECVDIGLLGPHSIEGNIREIAAKYGLVVKKKKRPKGQRIETMPTKSAPKKERVEAAFELLTRLGLTVDDLEREFGR